MAHSRLEKIGTIYTRVSGLIKAGAMKLEDRPLWYDLYQAFPPKYPPQFDRPVPTEPVRQILYPEDVIRAKFYKAVKNSPVPNLKDTEHQTLCQKCIVLCNNLQAEKNMTLDQAFEEAIHSLQIDSESKENKQEKELEPSSAQEKLSVNVKELFN